MAFELVDANSEMRAVFQSIPDLVLRFDRAGLVLDVKRGLGRPAGGPQAVRRQAIEDTPLRPAAQECLLAIRRIVAEEIPVSFEYAVADQQTYFEARLVPLPGEQIPRSCETLPSASMRNKKTPPCSTRSGN